MPIVVELPMDDSEFMIEYARASMMHTHLDNALKMFLRQLRGQSIDEALEYIGFKGAARMRDDIEKLAAQRFGDGEALAMVRDYMRQFEAVSERRNHYLHSPIARERDGAMRPYYMRARGGGNEWEPLPPAADLRALADETFALFEDFNRQRLSGAIDAALRAHQA